jgi:hypothetical protein
MPNNHIRKVIGMHVYKHERKRSNWKAPKESKAETQAQVEGWEKGKNEIRGMLLAKQKISLIYV